MPTGEAKKSGILKSDDRNVGDKTLSTGSKTVKYEGKAGSPSGKNVQKETDSQEKSESKDSKISGVVSKTPVAKEVSPSAQETSSSPRPDSVPQSQASQVPQGELEVLENGARNPNARTRATFSSQIVTIEQMTEEVEMRENVFGKLARNIRLSMEEPSDETIPTKKELM